MKYYLIAGEASGDIYGSQLIEEIQILDPNSEIRFWGGDLMKSKSDNLVKHYKETSIMGFFEVLKNIFKILNNINFCKKDILRFKPDRIIYIDYPGFNLRICKWAKENGFINHYFISPQICAWKENRINSIKRLKEIIIKLNMNLKYIIQDILLLTILINLNLMIIFFIKTI